MAVALAVMLVAATVGSYLGTLSWAFDLLSHFRVQLVAFGVVCTLAALLTSARIIAGFCLLLTFVHVVPLLPYVAGMRGAVAADRPLRDRLRVLTFNLHGHSTDLAALRQLIERENPDIVLLEEAPSGSAFIGDLKERYPFRLSEEGGVPLDLLLIARWKPVNWSVDRSVAQFRSVLTARFCSLATGEHCFTLVGLHADQPFGEGARRQQGQLAIAQRQVAAAESAVLVMGDLNMTPWSRTFQSFVERTGLFDTTKARGISATWRSRSPLFGLPIDHILLGSGFKLVETWIGEDLGSDHFPLFAELAFRAP